MKFCVNRRTQPDDKVSSSTTSRTLLNFKVTGQRSSSFFVSGPKFTKWFLSNVGKIVVDNAVFRLLIAWSVPDMFAIKVWSCPKSSAWTHEPLHLARWNLTRTCTSTTSRTLLNFKVIDQRSRSHGFWCFCVHNAAATRGRYLALSKGWWSCIPDCNCFRLGWVFTVKLKQFGF